MNRLERILAMQVKKYIGKQTMDTNWLDTDVRRKAVKAENIEPAAGTGVTSDIFYIMF